MQLFAHIAPAHKCNNSSTPQSIYSSSNLVLQYSARDALLVKLRRKNKSPQIF
jgi:hypothetical protein